MCAGGERWGREVFLKTEKVFALLKLLCALFSFGSFEEVVNTTLEFP